MNKFRATTHVTTSIGTPRRMTSGEPLQLLFSSPVRTPRGFSLLLGLLSSRTGFAFCNIAERFLNLLHHGRRITFDNSNVHMTRHEQRPVGICHVNTGHFGHLPRAWSLPLRCHQSQHINVRFRGDNLHRRPSSRTHWPTNAQLHFDSCLFLEVKLTSKFCYRPKNHLHEQFILASYDFLHIGIDESAAFPKARFLTRQRGRAPSTRV